MDADFSRGILYRSSCAKSDLMHGSKVSRAPRLQSTPCRLTKLYRCCTRGSKAGRSMSRSKRKTDNKRARKGKKSLSKKNNRAKSRTKSRTGARKKVKSRTGARGKGRAMAKGKAQKGRSSRDIKARADAARKAGSSWFSSLWSLRQPKRKGIKGRRPGRNRPLATVMREPRYMKDVKFNTYINRLRRKVLPRRNINQDSMGMMDCMVKNIMHGIGVKASTQMGRRKVLKPKMLHRAMKKVMPRSLSDRADEVGRQAVDRYRRNSRPRRPTAYRIAENSSHQFDPVVYSRFD